jgi:dipeptidyl aminopeptidase/acylaminoacyl peptidase
MKASHHFYRPAAGRRQSIPVMSILSLVIILILTACQNSAAANQPPATGPVQASTGRPAPAGNPPAESPPSPTRVPTETATATPTGTPAPTATPSPTPTPEPALRQLTTGGCCVQPSFSPDGEQVLFIDKPEERAPTGIYGVDLARPQPTPELANNTIGFRSPNRSIVAVIEGGLIRFTDETAGQSWTVDTGANWPRFSPDGSQILWVATDREGPYDRRQSDIWLANVDGSNPQLLLSVYGGGFAGWFPDGRRVLLIGKDLPAEERRTLFVYDLDSQERTNLLSHKRIRDAEISPGGGWIVFFLSMTQDEPLENGLWVVSPEGTAPQKLDVPGFGGFRWQDDKTLLYIPMRSSAEESMQLWAIDVESNQSRPVTDPDKLFFSISNGDWAVSPDGRQVIFVSSEDQNIYLITLP